MKIIPETAVLVSPTLPFSFLSDKMDIIISGGELGDNTGPTNS